MSIEDPMEKLIRDALRAAGIRYREENDPTNRAKLDFWLPDFGVYIEVKQFHSDRIAKQMASAENVIAVQGLLAVKFLAKLIEFGSFPTRSAETYLCPVCKSNDPNRYLRCDYPGCTDGRNTR